MKKTILASVLLVATATTAHAEGGIMSSIKPDASLEYAFEASKWSGDMGVSAGVFGITIRPALDFSYKNGDSMTFDGAEIKGTMPLSQGLSAYSKLNLTNKFKYSDVTVGVAFSF
jgi:hypothetical protein